MKKQILALLCILTIVCSLMSGLIACNKTYTITYVMPLEEGGNLTDVNVYDTLTQPKGSEIEFPDTPVTTAYGYEFGGWYDSNDNLIQEKSIKVNSDMTLYGKWVKISHTITYDLQGGGSMRYNEKNPESYTLIDGVASFYEPVSNRDGYEFLGWYDEEGTRWESVKRGTDKDLTLYAQWGEISYPIEYRGLESDGKNSEENPMYYTVSQEVILKEATRRGYTFAGWYDKAEGGNKIEKIQKGTTEKLILYAHWQIINYNLSFELAGGYFQEGTEIPTTYTIDGIGLPRPVKDGYFFTGWLDNDRGNIYQTIPAGSIGNRNYTAQWSLYEYTLRYTEVLYEGEEMIDAFMGEDSVKFTVNDEIIIADVFTLPEREGYTFLGWYLNYDKSSDVLTKIEKGTSKNVDIYAIWQKN